MSAIGLMGTLALESGCYVYVPSAAPATEPGVNYKFIINDQGRAAFAERVGPGVTSIEGKLVNQNPDAYVVSVATVESISAGPSHWSGEQVTVSKQHVVSVHERQLSRSRTALAVGAAVGAVAAFFVTRAIIGGGSDEPGGGEPPPPGSSVIIPIPR